MRHAILVALAMLSAAAFSLSPRPRADDLEAKLAALRALDRATPWPATTAATIGARLRHDPARCTAFLRAHVRHEPYAGVLRGSDGVLGAGGGNSIELCRLLRDMLAREGGPRLRFAWTTLAEDVAARLVTEAAEAPPARAAMLGAADAAAMAPETAPPRVAAEAAAARQELVDAGLDLAQVRAHLRGGDTDREDAVVAARTHAWLQVEDEGRWVSFDPAALLPLPDEGVTFGDELPDAAHRIAVQIQVERWSAGRLQRETLFEGEWPTARLWGKAIDVVLAPENLALDPMLGGDRKPQTLTEQANGFHAFGCLVGLTGEALVPGRAFGLSGRGKAPASQPLAIDPFARMGRGRPTPEASTLTGVFATFTLRSPGAEPVAVERSFLDRVGAAARRSGKVEVAPLQGAEAARVALALLQRHRALVPTGGLGLPRLAQEALQALVTRTCLEDAVALRRGTFRGKPGDALAGLPDLPIELCQLSDSALELTAASLAGEGVCFLARPNLVVLSELLQLEGADRLVERTIVDLAVHRLAALGDAAAVAAARTFHGLVASEIEGRSVRGAVTFAARILREAAAQRVPMRVLTAVADASAVAVPDDVRALLVRDLAAGAHLLAPEKSVVLDGRPRFSWWRLGPGGEVLAIGEDGRGQGGSEGLFVLKEISIPMVKRCMKFVQCLNAAVAGGGGVREAGAACLSQAIQDVVKDSLDKAIGHFVRNPLNQQVDATRAAMLGPEYEALYQKAKAAFASYQQAQNALGAAGRTAEGGAEIGAAMGGRLYLMLTIGRDIAEYASGL